MLVPGYEPGVPHIVYMYDNGDTKPFRQRQGQLQGRDHNSFPGSGETPRVFKKIRLFGLKQHDARSEVRGEGSSGRRPDDQNIRQMRWGRVRAGRSGRVLGQKAQKRGFRGALGSQSAPNRLLWFHEEVHSRGRGGRGVGPDFMFQGTLRQVFMCWTPYDPRRKSM